MYKSNNMQTVMEAAKVKGVPIWAGFAVRRGRHVEILSFISKKEVLVEDLLDLVFDYDFDVVDLMHTNADEICALTILKSRLDLPLIGHPVSGSRFSPNWDFDNINSE